MSREVWLAGRRPMGSKNAFVLGRDARIEE
jgi:hypothetical protein